MKGIEVGAPICCSSKKCILGKQSTGTRNRVIVSLNCPQGFQVRGSWHSHPGLGDRAYLSTADIVALKKAGLRVGCVSSGKIMRCFRVK